MPNLIPRSFLLLLTSLAIAAGACTHISTVRLQPDSVAVGPNLRPIAALQADAISGYVAFIPIPGVDLDKVVNQMLIAAAKTIGADKIANLRFEIDPAGGIWSLRKLLFYRSARASGIAVQVIMPEPDPKEMEGPEPEKTHEPTPKQKPVPEQVSEPASSPPK